MDYDLNIMESSHSITRLQIRKNIFRINSKFLMNLFLNLKFNFFQLVRTKIFTYLVLYKSSKHCEDSNTAQLVYSELFVLVLRILLRIVL